MLGARGREEWGVTDNDYGVSFGDDVNVLKLDSGYGCTTLRIYKKPFNGMLQKGEFYSI